MPMSNEAKNYMLDQRFGSGVNSGTFVALGYDAGAVLPADATAALAEELNGAPYARVELNLAAAAAGAKALAASAVVNIQAGDQFNYYTLWRVGSGGTAAEYLGSALLSAAEGAYGSNGTYTISAIPISL